MKGRNNFGIIGVIAVFLSVIFIAGAIVFGVNALSVGSGNASLESSLTEKRGVLSIMPDSELTVEYLQQMLYSAKDVGTEIANANNNAWNTIWDKPDDVKANDAYAKAKEYLSSVDAYFPNNGDNTSGWFAIHDMETGDRSQWEFMTTYSFSGHKTDCIWLCRRQSDNQIMAYVTAVFDADNGTFSSPKHHETVYGTVWKAEFAE